MSCYDGSIVEHLKQESDNFVQSRISQNWLICFWWFQIYVKDDILIHLIHAWKSKFGFQKVFKTFFWPWVYSRTLETRKIQLCSIKDISKLTYSFLTILNQCERGHFDTLNKLMKVQSRISRCFLNFCFSHGSIVEHLQQERYNFVQSRICQNWFICFWRF